MIYRRFNCTSSENTVPKKTQNKTKNLIFQTLLSFIHKVLVLRWEAVMWFWQMDLNNLAIFSKPGFIS